MILFGCVTKPQLEPPTPFMCLDLCVCVCVSHAAGADLLNPENDTVGILVSTALDITIGGKTVKPAGEQTEKRHYKW